jgi:hypothetical protein
VEERATTADAQDKDRLGNNRRRGAVAVVAVVVMREAILNDASFMEWDELGQLRERERDTHTHTHNKSFL